MSRSKGLLPYHIDRLRQQRMYDLYEAEPYLTLEERNQRALVFFKLKYRKKFKLVAVENLQKKECEV